MGREIRRIPMNWQHPETNGHKRPLLRTSYPEAIAEWTAEHELFKRGLRSSMMGGTLPMPADYNGTFEQWHGRQPKPEYHMPAWNESDGPFGFAMYENTTEGTPMTPTFATPAELVDFLVETGPEHDGKLERKHAVAFVGREVEQNGW